MHDESILWDILHYSGLKTKQPISGFGDEPPEKRPFGDIPKSHYFDYPGEEEEPLFKPTPPKQPSIPSVPKLGSLAIGLPPKGSTSLEPTILFPTTPPLATIGTEELEETPSQKRSKRLESLTQRYSKRIGAPAAITEEAPLDFPYFDEVLSPENVVPVPTPPLPYSEFEDLDRELVVDKIHETQVRRSVPMPPYMPRTNEEQECMPSMMGRDLFLINKETTQVSYISVYYLQHEYKAILNYIHSSPSGYLNFLQMEIPKTPPLFLTLAMLASLTIQDDSSLIRYMAEKIHLHFEHRPPSIIYFGFQIKAETIYEKPGTINKLTVTSPVYCIPFEYFEEEYYNRLLNWFDDLRLKEGNTDYDRFFTDSFLQYQVTQWNTIFFNLVDSGGCGDIQKNVSKTILQFVDSPQVRKNYCFFAVLLRDEHFKKRYLPYVDGTEKLEKIRSDAGLPLNDQPVFFNQFADICIHLNFSLHVYTEHTSQYEEEKFNKRIVLDKDNRLDYELNNDQPYGPVVSMLFIKRNGSGHFYYIKDLSGLLRLRCCRHCFLWFDNQTEAFARHDEACKPCSKCGRRDTPNHNCDDRNRNRKFDKEKVPKRKQKPWNEKVWFADFETFTRPDGLQRVYSAAIVSIEHIKNYKTEQLDDAEVLCEQFYGDHCLSLFVDFILQIKGKSTICFYNGSRFDYYFILNELIRRKLPFTLKKDEKSNSIMIFNTKNIRFFDLLKFTLCSLSAACKSFNVPKEYCKTDFDHNKVYDQVSAERHKLEVIDYNIKDVQSMGILYYILATNFHQYWKISLKEYISSSQLSYDVWIKSIPVEHKNALCHPNRDTYPFLRRALFGGRVYCGLPVYDSNIIPVDMLLYDWPDFATKKRARIVESIKDHPDQIKVEDVNSLYPWCAQRGATFSNLVQGLYPVGNYEFVNESLFANHLGWFDCLLKKKSIYPRDDDLMQRCFYEVDVTCPNDLDIPFLLSHELNGTQHHKLVANLLPKTYQVYSGIILQYAVKNYGYQVTKIHKILKFGRLLPIMYDYMADLMKRKDECQEKNDMVGRNMFKQAANSFTGKHSERMHEDVTQIEYTDEFMKFFDHDTVVTKDLKIETFFNGLEAQAYYVTTKEMDERKIFSKCPQIGVVILDYSKMMMDMIMRRLYLQDKNKLFYTDTDSLLIKLGVRLQDHSQMWGPIYGQLKDEYPDIVWTYGVFYAPKTYALLGLCKKTFAVVLLIKAKGAPQDKTQATDKGIYYIEDLEKKCGKSQHPSTDLKHVMYYLVKDGVVEEECTYIRFRWFMGLIFDPETKIMVHYGSLKKIFNEPRFLIDEKLTAFYIEKISAHRTLNQSDPWGLKGETNPRDLTRVSVLGKTYPRGHKLDPFLNS